MKDDYDKATSLTRRLAPCLCGAGRRHIKRMMSLENDEIGLICWKCERFALGADIDDSIKNWNRRQGW